METYMKKVPYLYIALNIVIGLFSLLRIGVTPDWLYVVIVIIYHIIVVGFVVAYSKNTYDYYVDMLLLLSFIPIIFDDIFPIPFLAITIVQIIKHRKQNMHILKRIILCLFVTLFLLTGIGYVFTANIYSAKEVRGDMIYSTTIPANMMMSDAGEYKTEKIYFGIFKKTIEEVSHTVGGPIDIGTYPYKAKNIIRFYELKLEKYRKQLLR